MTTMTLVSNDRASCGRADNLPSGHGGPVRTKVIASPNLIAAARRYWMNKVGLSPKEIEEFCDLDAYPGTMEDELEQIAALPEIDRLCEQIKWNI